jgi:hypothetical protein
MDATQDYPHLSQWPRGAPVPTHALLVQAYALLRAARVSNNPEGTRDALALAAHDPRDTAVEMGGGDVVGLSMSPPPTPAQPESAKSAKLPR